MLGPDGSVRPLEAPANVPLGVTMPDAYRGREHTLGPGSVLMLYSNGLSDCTARDPGADARTLLSASSRRAGTDLERLADHLISHSSPQHCRDDAVLLVARYEGAVGEDGPRTGNLHISPRPARGENGARLRSRPVVLLGTRGHVGRPSAHRLRGRDQRADPRRQ
ncbi:SpoIIE family protein phosphatase [Streptomyces sp. NPDC002573]|uniref:SpoIIE family protein phosphatase n=1 Tax=Streptomyces sp. NPDC002573 TaxID=3364651 RepID=UPI0036C29260